MVQRPPRGAIPRWLHNEMHFDDLTSQSRLDDLNGAIDRHKGLVDKFGYIKLWQKEKEEIEEVLK